MLRLIPVLVPRAETSPGTAARTLRECRGRMLGMETFETETLTFAGRILRQEQRRRREGRSAKGMPRDRTLCNASAVPWQRGQQGRELILGWVGLPEKGRTAWDAKA